MRKFKKVFFCSFAFLGLSFPLHTQASGETIAIDKCAVLKSQEKKSSCLGTGLNNDPARDPQLYFYNQCDTKIAVKQCFLFPNGNVVDAIEYIKPGVTRRIYKCTESSNPKVQGSPRMEPKPTKYFVFDPANDSSYKYKCD
ncbi:hypothetical protein AT00_03670 [Pseudoalteromonas lipolytica SCSIO 04301]|uniref:Secreted protein n=1 Tax=Pseudoalteromonas lipolytica TaxID=570156 RepID=A0ABY1GIT2_9GAMM|nr:hypothetical protein [Pseudoalteromonas lipolytica]EWH07395.1 hypothetical protein AT00_03670 [Pseudoalteromonas lipolytica SCSIO 04301]SFT80669.1 hypothetical protein SAMN04487854_11079 [Pseudoalteromonas lipolytica]